MTRAIEKLPDDPAILKRMLVEQFDVIEQIKEESAAKLQQIKEDAAAEIARLNEEHKAAIAALFRRYYGPRAEKFDPRQLLLFGMKLDQMPLNEANIAEESGEKLVTRRVKNRDKHGRQQLPEHLERIEIEHDLNDVDKPCPCCGEVRHPIGCEVSEQLEYFPANFKVLKHLRYKYACAHCDHEGYNPNIIAAKKPPQPIEKGLPGPSLLAYVITSKLGDHLPLYRLENIFHRQKVHIARSTMCAWMRAAGELVAPLVELMTSRVRSSQVIHTDDTIIPIQSPIASIYKDGQCRKGRIWCYLGDSAHPYTVYDYTPNRSRAGPAAWLEGYEGYLQADAYGGYDGIYADEQVTEVACWAHARRKFYDAQDSDSRRAVQMLALIGKLYSIEREAKTSDDAARLALRQQRSLPVLAEIKTWLSAEGESVIPRSPIDKAIRYAQNQWPALCTYTTQGFLNIDNNAAERALKRVAIGRKNWLFAGNDRAAENHALLWSLIASCDRHQLDPQRYLTSLLAKISQTPPDQLSQFLPDVWKQEDKAEPIPTPPPQS